VVSHSVSRNLFRKLSLWISNDSLNKRTFYQRGDHMNVWRGSNTSITADRVLKFYIWKSIPFWLRYFLIKIKNIMTEIVRNIYHHHHHYHCQYLHRIKLKSCGLWHRALLRQDTNVSDVHAASICSQNHTVSRLRRTRIFTAMKNQTSHLHGLSHLHISKFSDFPSFLWSMSFSSTFECTLIKFKKSSFSYFTILQMLSNMFKPPPLLW
jgi:hypothetical protein